MCEYILFNERTNEIVNESELKNEHENEKIWMIEWKNERMNH